MRFLLTIAFIFSVAFPAWANWVKVGETADMVFYVDLSLAKTPGQRHRVLELMDLKERDEDGHLSLRALVEYDCKSGQTRTLSMSGYSGPMASGMVLFNISNPGDWNDETPGTTGGSLLNTLCNP